MAKSWLLSYLNQLTSYGGILISCLCPAYLLRSNQWFIIHWRHIWVKRDAEPHLWRLRFSSHLSLLEFLLTKVFIKSYLPSWAFLVAQLVKNPPAMQKVPVWFLGWQDSLEKGYITHSSILGVPWWLRW